MVGVIYQIVNTKNGKKYIGSSIEFNKRKSRHLYELRKGVHHSIYLQRAWNKYGEESFEFKIIEEVYEEELHVVENRYLSEISIQTHYNVSCVAGGGDNISNHPELEKIKEKQSKNTIDRWNSKSEEEKKQHAENLKGNKNPNWKGGRKKCKCGTEINKSASQCLKCTDRSGSNNSFYGKHHTKETKEKLSKANKGRIPTNSKAVIIDGIEYASATQASKVIRCSVATIGNRIKNPKFNYQYKV